MNLVQQSVKQIHKESLKNYYDVTRAEDDVVHEKSDVSQLVDQHTERLLQKFATATPGPDGISPTTTATTHTTEAVDSSTDH